MLVFLDFEASSLGKKSFPVEVAWVFEDGTSRSHLIRPAPDWQDWSMKAEHIHGLTRRRLHAEGTPVAEVAREMMETLEGHALYASAPSWDGKWLSVLLRAGGLPRHALRLAKSDDVFLAHARSIMDETFTRREIAAFVAEMIEQTEPAQPVHRALADATLEHTRWLNIREAAAKAVEARRQAAP
ncbi:transcriptional regulator [Rhizobium sp. Leaf384]|uniref:hypothetical protein n=1 Tax=unclassified Rhizobium TaxID=2613769 RepID=UPI000715CFB3|nr:MULTISPECIES: hypothetical protein [unclassified Rhizobium]KQS75685.1 transcriptional regulator [Rhizobium sp. Leaf384]KQS75934.1 transcriptional regulator [Rhizobium sp. Leaf383]